MSNFCITFPLITEKYQEDILNKRFEIARKIYNSLITVTQKRYKEMIKTKKYRSVKSELKTTYDNADTKKQKELYKELNQIYKDYDLNEYSFHADVKHIQKHFSDNIDSFTAQKIATTLWKSYDKLLFGNGEYVHYKKYDSLNSVEGKSNKSGIRFKNDTLSWNGLSIPVKINYNNYYEYQCMQSTICYNRIVRKFVRGRYKFYVQIIFKGIPPTKIDRETGEVKHPLGVGDVGLDIGTQTLAISSKTDVKLLELADRVQNIENEKRRLLRYMDRRKRANNPDNYNEDGTIKKQGNKKVLWNMSKRYVKAKNKLKELYRKQADIRKLQHESLANYILSLGDTIYVEKMNYSGLQKRSINTTINEKTGRINKKKRFGKSLANKAPAMLLEIIDRKLKYYDLGLIRINTQKCKASQYNHFTNEYNKKELKDRWNKDIQIQRDLYSAFLIMNVDKSLESINQEQCNKTYDNFKKLHDTEIERLRKLKVSGYKLISSMGI